MTVIIKYILILLCLLNIFHFANASEKTDGIKTEDWLNYLNSTGKGQDFFEEYDSYSSDELHDDYKRNKENHQIEVIEKQDEATPFQTEEEQKEVTQNYEKKSKSGFSFSQMANLLQKEE